MRKRQIFFILLLLITLAIAAFDVVPADAAETKRLQFFIGQETVVRNPGEQIDTPFSMFLGETIIVVRGATIEIKGVSQDPSNPTVQVSIDDPTFAQPRARTFMLDSTNRTEPFKILYDATSYLAPIITEAGSWSFTLNVKINGVTVSLLSAKMRFIYSFEPRFLVSGYMESSTYDTQVPEGAGYNAIMWKGNLPATSRVKFQFATSNDPDGPWPSSFAGPDGLPTSYYEPSGPDIPIRISPAYHNNKRYFRYRIFLWASNNGLASPRVDDVIVNWSP